VLARLVCEYWRGGHWDTERHPLGGLRCLSCLAPLADLGEAGTMDSAHIPGVRRVYGRERGGTLVRTDAWTQNKRGEW
jgi:hypothetical protein